MPRSDSAFPFHNVNIVDYWVFKNKLDDHSVSGRVEDITYKKLKHLVLQDFPDEGKSPSTDYK